MENGLWSDIQEQGKNLRHVVHRLYGEERARLETAARFLRNDRPIAMIGVASAEYLCMPAAAYLGEHGRFATTLCAADGQFISSARSARANVVINSRSGETVEVVDWAARWRGTHPLRHLTNEPRSTLARLADAWSGRHAQGRAGLDQRGHRDDDCHAGAGGGGDWASWIELHPDLERLAEAMDGVVDRAATRADYFNALCRRHAPALPALPRARQRRGLLRAAGARGDLTQPSIAMDAAEFRQGPNEVIDEHFAAVVFCGAGKPGELNLSLAGDIQSSGGK